MSAYIAERYRVAVAPEQQYGHMVSDASAFQEIRPESEGFTHEGHTEILERSRVRAGLGNDASLPGAKSCLVKLSLPARSGGEASMTGAASMCRELETLVKACLGELNADHGEYLNGGNATSFISDNPAAESFTPGGLVWIRPGGSGEFHPRWISRIDRESNSAIFAGDWHGGSAWNLPASCTDAGFVHASVQGRPGSSALATACLEVSGLPIQGKGPIWRYMGLVGNLRLDDAAAQKRVLLSFDLKGDSYEITSGLSSLTQAQGCSPWPGVPGDLRSLSADFRINGARTAYRSFSLDLGNNWAECLDGNATNGRSSYVLTRIATTGKCVVYWDENHADRLERGDRFDISWITGEPGNAIGFHAPECEVRSLKESAINGLLSMEIGFAVLPSDLEDISDWTLAFSGHAAE